MIGLHVPNSCLRSMHYAPLPPFIGGGGGRELPCKPHSSSSAHSGACHPLPFMLCDFSLAAPFSLPFPRRLPTTMLPDSGTSMGAIVAPGRRTHRQSTSRKTGLHPNAMHIAAHNVSRSAKERVIRQEIRRTGGHSENEDEGEGLWNLQGL